MATRKRKGKLSPISKEEYDKFEVLSKAFVRKNLVQLAREMQNWDRNDLLPPDAGFRRFVLTIEATLKIDVQSAMKVGRGFIQDAAFEYILKVADAQAMMKDLTAMPKEEKGG